MLEKQPVKTSWKQFFFFFFKDKDVMNKLKNLHLFQHNPTGLVSAVKHTKVFITVNKLIFRNTSTKTVIFIHLLNNLQI